MSRRFRCWQYCVRKFLRSRRSSGSERRAGTQSGDADSPLTFGGLPPETRTSAVSVTQFGHVPKMPPISGLAKNLVMGTLLSRVEERRSFLLS